MQNQDELCIFLPPASPSGILTRPLYRGNSTTGTAAVPEDSKQGLERRGAKGLSPSRMSLLICHFDSPFCHFGRIVGGGATRTAILAGIRLSTNIAWLRIEIVWPPRSVPQRRPRTPARASRQYLQTATAGTRRCWRRPIRSRSATNSRSSAAHPPSRSSGCRRSATFTSA